jgi:hypothetical protein
MVLFQTAKANNNTRGNKVAKIKTTEQDSVAIVLTGTAVTSAVKAREALTKSLGFEPSWRQTVALALSQFNKANDE